MLQTWNLLVYVARLRKKSILWRTLAKIVEKIKVTELKYLITAWLHSNNPLQRKGARRRVTSKRRSCRLQTADRADHADNAD